jgi:hypothetical protein
MPRRLPWAVAVVAAALALGGVVWAQTGGGFDLTWSTVDGGGFTFSSGSGYELGGTIGQPDAGEASGGATRSAAASGQRST